jgi:hypothetical protein
MEKELRLDPPALGEPSGVPARGARGERGAMGVDGERAMDVMGKASGGGAASGSVQWAPDAARLSLAIRARG